MPKYYESAEEREKAREKSRGEYRAKREKEFVKKTYELSISITDDLDYFCKNANDNSLPTNSKGISKSGIVELALKKFLESKKAKSAVSGKARKS